MSMTTGTVVPIVVSTVTLSNVKSALKIDYTADDDYIEKVIMPSAKGRLKALTGLDDDGLDDYNELIMAYLLLCADYYDGTEDRKPAYTSIVHSLQMTLLGADDEDDE